MIVSQQDADLFFDLTWSLFSFVNKKHNVYKGITSREALEDLSMIKKIKLRNILYDHIDLIDAYIAENPDQLEQEALSIIKDWKYFQRGNFLIIRHLKKYSALIQNDKVYGVLGLNEPFSDVLRTNQVPYFIATVLLPFKGKIIYDGIIESYSVTIGSGMKSIFHEIYMTAKKNGQIIDQLDTPLTPKIKAMTPKID